MFEKPKVEKESDESSEDERTKRFRKRQEIEEFDKNKLNNDIPEYLLDSFF